MVSSADFRPERASSPAGSKTELDKKTRGQRKSQIQINQIKTKRADLDETEDLLEFEALVRLFPGRLDERIDEERVLCDALCDKEDAFWNSLLFAQRIHGTLSGKSGKFSVFFDHLLVHRDGLLMSATEFTVERAQLVAQQARELNPQNIFDGRHDRLLTLSLSQSTQELQVVLDQLLQTGKDTVDRLRSESHFTSHPFSEDLKVKTKKNNPINSEKNLRKRQSQIHSITFCMTLSVRQ